jgi:hypothetical protein
MKRNFFNGFRRQLSQEWNIADVLEPSIKFIIIVFINFILERIINGWSIVLQLQYLVTSDAWRHHIGVGYNGARSLERS